MKRDLLIGIALTFALLFTVDNSYACKTAPTAKIVSPDDPHYILPGSSVSFDGEGSASAVPPTGSYDHDNGSPYGGGRGINKYEWHYGDEASGADYWHEDGATPTHTYNDADEYTVYLKVTDDDDPCQTDVSEGCTIYAVRVEIYDPAPSEFPKYIGIGTRLTLRARIIPSSATGGEFTWSKVSGPGTVTFTPSDESTTSFSADTVGSYTVKVQYTIEGVTCSDTSGTIEVCNAKMIFKTGEPPTETSSLTREESGTFEVVNGDGDPIEGATYSNWAFDGEVDVSDPSNTSSTWSGTIVQSGEASCTVTFGDITCEVNKSITANARSGWSITPTCAQDNDPSWGDYIGPVSTHCGENGDIRTQTGAVIVPQGTNFQDGYTTAEVSSGPNNNVWYISTSTFEIDHETVINKFIKPGTTGYPDPPNENLYEHNVSEGVDADGFLQGVKNHEAYGTGTNRNGHQAFLDDEEAKPGNDVKEEIEDNVAGSDSTLKSNTSAEVWGIDQTIYAAYIEEATGNWSGMYYIYDFGMQSWVQSAWSH